MTKTPLHHDFAAACSVGDVRRQVHLARVVAKRVLLQDGVNVERFFDRIEELAGPRDLADWNNLLQPGECCVRTRYCHRSDDDTGHLQGLNSVRPAHSQLPAGLFRDRVQKECLDTILRS